MFWGHSTHNQVHTACPYVTPMNAMNNPNALPAAKDCDPLALGWMQGSPPAADKIIRFEDGSG